MADTEAVMKFVPNLMVTTKQYVRKRTKVVNANRDETPLSKADEEKLELPTIPLGSDPVKDIVVSSEEICLKDTSVTPSLECSDYVDSTANFDPIKEDDNKNDKTPLDFAKNLVKDEDNDKDSIFSSESKQVNVESGIAQDESRDLDVKSTVQTVTDSYDQKDTEEVEEPRRGRKRKKLNSPIKSEFVNAEIKKEANEFEECKDSDNGKCKLIKSPRGRKRKNSQTSECENVNEAEKEVKHDTNQFVGRVLRSRKTLKIEYAETKKEADVTETESEHDESPMHTEKRRKKVKGKRGRHQGKNELSVSKVISKKKVQIVALNPEKKGKIAKLEKEKVNVENIMCHRTPRQLARDQLESMLLKAGWTIEHRPRQDTDYLAAVYVDHDGKTHWSITLAYKKFKEKIENGTADSQEVSAYSPIPEVTLKCLMRKTGDKLKKVKVKEKEKKKEKEKEKGTKGKNKKVDKTQNKQKVEKRRGRKPIALLARKSGAQRSDGVEGYIGKIGLLSWMIDLGVIVIGSKVNYMNPVDKKVVISGQITNEGIHCGCCNQTVSTYDFMTHSGTLQCQLYDNIYLESGISLLQCLAKSWKKEMESFGIGFCHVDIDGIDPNDDRCNICGDGGHLICCDGCPSTFHKSCLEIDKFPSGEWRCVYCSCKFCKTVNNCNEKDSSELQECRMCEEKYHLMCTEVKDDSKDQSFCGEKCDTIFENLQNLLGVKQDLEDGYSWTLLRRFEIDEGIPAEESRLEIESNSKLAVARFVMDECFMTIMDERSESNMINNIIFGCGSNIKRVNFSGFATAVLERGDEIISAASIRIHGDRLAEMPFIGTRHVYRRQGMCRRLLTAIESALSLLDVKKLVIPAISELKETWTSVFGFEQIEEEKRKEMNCLSMVVFPGVDMLQKPILNTLASGEEMVLDETTGVSPAIVLDESGANDAELSSLIGSDTTNCEEKAAQIVLDITNFEDKSAEIVSDVTNLEEKDIPESANSAEKGITNFEEKTGQSGSCLTNSMEKADLIQQNWMQGV